MKTLLLMMLMVISSTSFGAPCYDTVDGDSFCPNDSRSAQVLIFNAGWCPPCNAKMPAMVRLSQELSDVEFASLSGEGWGRGSRPDRVFLESWKRRHGIPFTVAGRHRDFGRHWGGRGSIPFVVVLDASGRILKRGNLDAWDIREALR